MRIKSDKPRLRAVRNEQTKVNAQLVQHAQLNPFALKEWIGSKSRSSLLHWVQNVLMREDQSQSQAGNAADNLATLQHRAVNIKLGENQIARHRGQGT